jgi:hypothetical protein
MQTEDRWVALYRYSNEKLTARLGVALDPPFKRAVEHEAARRGLSVSDYVRYTLLNQLESNGVRKGRKVI